MIKIESLSKAFGEKSVITNLNLEIPKNNVTVLLGPNGSGKTTLLNMISGLLPPDRGRIYINNHLVNGDKKGTKTVNVKPFERKIGYVFQSVSLFPHMKIYDNIAYGLKSLHLSKAEIKTRTINMLEFVDLTDFAQTYPNQLSGGQQQRAAIARSLVTEPQLLLLDEPISAVDPQHIETFRLDLKKYLQTLKITTLYVTHNLNEAFMMADNIAILGNGHIEQTGNPTEIFNTPKSTFVANFLGFNIFKAKAVKEQNGYLIVKVKNIPLLAMLDLNLTEKNIILTIKPEDLTISTEKQTNHKSNNNLLGTITEIEQTLSTTQFTIDVGFPIKAKTTTTATKNLGVTIGDRVYVSFSSEVLNVFLEK
ncbi:MAG: ABC transporter ATP-binding protein [Nitrososphaerota archaeon]|jgi:ABC-type Fe3+/spermidine/putrescine transport system ATPase subunit|nr:ABC transporter ATP-binding protein [Nitrososphaerota archaeon]